MIMPRPFLGCQIKAEIKGFLLMYRLFQYKHWFLSNFELEDFPVNSVLQKRVEKIQKVISVQCNVVYVYEKCLENTRIKSVPDEKSWVTAMNTARSRFVWPISSIGWIMTDCKGSSMIISNITKS